VLEHLNFGGIVQPGIFRFPYFRNVRLVIMVAIVNLNGNEYIECENCGTYELYEVSRLHRVQDGAERWLCRQCIPVSCIVSGKVMMS
jgi:hypothetical protein